MRPFLYARSFHLRQPLANPCVPVVVHVFRRRLKETVLKWLPVAVNQAIDGEAPETGDSPIKTGVGGEGGELRTQTGAGQPTGHCL
jgi:hypothetical protein